MAIIDEIKEQQAKLKDKSFQEKLGYFWDYYKIHTALAVFVLILLISFISNYRESSKECVIYALLLNGYPVTDTNALLQEFLVENGYEAEKVNAYIESNMTLSLETPDPSSVATMQKLSVLAQSGDLDVVVATEDVTAYYAEQEFFYDLRDILPEEKLQQYEAAGQLVYEQASPTDSTLVPVGIKGEAFPRLMETQAYDKDDKPVVSVIVTSKRVENALQFLDFLEEKPNM